MRSNDECGAVIYDMLEPLTGRFSSSCPVVVRNSLVLGFVGFGVFAIAFCAYGIVYKEFYLPWISPGMAMRSYGQEFGASALIAGLLGMAAGWSIALSLHGRFLIAALLCIAASLATATFALSVWKESIAANGADASDAILFPPLLFLSGGAIAMVAVVSAALSISARVKTLPVKTK